MLAAHHRLNLLRHVGAEQESLVGNDAVEVRERLRQRTGSNFLQAPREFEFEGEEVIVRKEGDRLIAEPIRRGRLLSLLETLEPLDEPFPDVDEDVPPLDDVDL